MSKFLLFLLGALAGALIGGVLVFYYFVGAPRAVQIPGEPIKAPDASGIPPGTATLTLNQQFFEAVLQTIFRDMNAPAFPLNLAKQNAEAREFEPQKILFQENGCDGKITLLPEGSGVKTDVRFENGKISAPLAFSGSASVLGQCFPFTGWAQAGLDLYFEPNEQTVNGKINVETVNLDGISPIASPIIAQFVQNSLNNRVNPIPVLRGRQIALNLPIAATGGTLNAQVKDVRAEVKENNLNLFVSYDFKGVK
jgi:hypothetical protein